MKVVKKEYFSFQIDNKKTQHKCEQCNREFLLYHFVYQGVRDDDEIFKKAREKGLIKIKAICPACGNAQKKEMQLKVNMVQSVINSSFYLEKVED